MEKSSSERVLVVESDDALRTSIVGAFSDARYDDSTEVPPIGPQTWTIPWQLFVRSRSSQLISPCAIGNACEACLITGSKPIRRPRGSVNTTPILGGPWLSVRNTMSSSPSERQSPVSSGSSSSITLRGLVFLTLTFTRLASLRTGLGMISIKNVSAFTTFELRTMARMRVLLCSRV